jgi:hypothetical protein
MSAKSLGLFLILMASGLWAVAQPAYVPIEQRLSPEQLKATGLNTLSPAQLAALNKVLSEEKLLTTAAPVSSVSPAMTVAPAMAMAEAPLPIAASTPTATVAPQGLGAPPPADKPILGFNEKPIVSRLKGTITGWDEGTVFELENGQQWKVLKGKMKLPKPMTNPEVKVVPGIVGRWFLQVSEDYPMARVYLIN